MNLKERAKKLKTEIPAVFLAMKRKETPWYAKVLAGMTVFYALSPIDLIPDFIPLVGLLDDVIILPILVAFTLKSIPKDIITECRAEPESMWKDGKPKSWKYGIPIVIFWIVVVFLVARAIWL